MKQGDVIVFINENYSPTFPPSERNIFFGIVRDLGQDGYRNEPVALIDFYHHRTDISHGRNWMECKYLRVIGHEV